MKNIIQINRKIVLLLMPIALILLPFQYQKTNDIPGKWAFSNSPREIEIYLENNKYYGKIYPLQKVNENKISGQPYNLPMPRQPL